jgi:hypothetical protein
MASSLLQTNSGDFVNRLSTLSNNGLCSPSQQVSSKTRVIRRLGPRAHCSNYTKFSAPELGTAAACLFDDTLGHVPRIKSTTKPPYDDQPLK